MVVPLLLGAAYHARVDLPARLAAAASTNPYAPLAGVATLGSDTQLDDVLVFVGSAGRW